MLEGTAIVWRQYLEKTSVGVDGGETHRSQLDSNADVKTTMTVVACEIKRIKRCNLFPLFFFSKKKKTTVRTYSLIFSLFRLAEKVSFYEKPVGKHNFLWRVGVGSNIYAITLFSFRVKSHIMISL